MNPANPTSPPTPTQTFFRPVGKKELELIQASGMTAFPPRLFWQPIFYPVLTEPYATQIARDWNTVDEASGFEGHVTRFHVDVRETLKGPAASEVEVFAWGGAVDGIGQQVVGQAAPAVGDEAVFFLEPAPLAGHWHVVGLAQGFWPLTRDAEGVPQVSRSASRLSLRVPGQPPSTALVPDRGASPVAYDVFRAQVLRAAREAP